jgi:hypothetical protein
VISKRCAYYFGLMALFMVAAPLWAHHGVQAYDMSRTLVLKGTIANFEWTNPHSQVHLDVADEHGQLAHWDFEAQPPSILAHAGWTRNSLKPGDQVTIYMHPAKNGTSIGILMKVVLANGQELTQDER